MQWQYRTILFEFTKDGLLGDRYVDDEDMEKTLNQLGREEWELVNVTLLQDGVLAFLKRAVQRAEASAAVPAEEESTTVLPPPFAKPAELPPRAPLFSSSPEPEPEKEPDEEAFEPDLPPLRPRRQAPPKDDLDFIGGIKIS